ncbi:FAD-dependent monooxygenase [Sphaerisporangium sp. B11E5]|uniref:FAD-dependent monooxygenase n=1 Tax=Sphaerisporangium sp. B11E5 TaxID=3153563 RepID=UPI00325CCE91
MEEISVLVSGAGVAGPSAALWLARYGCAVTVVERAPAPREGGQALDFKGRHQMTVLERMGVLDEVRRRQTGGTDQVVVDGDGRRLAVIPGEFTGGEVEILRGDLAGLLHERTRDRCEYVFGDSVTSLTEVPDGVLVTFERGEPRTYDLVVGADGIHSTVRRLAFGPEEECVRFLGYHYALADLGGEGGGAMYNEPGRMIAAGGAGPALFVFASEDPELARRDAATQKRALLDVYAGMGWRTRELIARLPDAPGFYLDSISRVEIPRYTKGRVALLGDAAHGNTLGGFGNGLAVVGAYVLAGELAAAGGDHRVAFPAYDRTMHGYAKIARSGNAGPFLAPPTRWRIRMRNAMFNRRLMLRLMLTLTDRFATDIVLKDYPLPRHA